ncbi:MAG: 3-methyl-2-oxobutanoate hydroxymethyltransferase [Elusimicrobia bacterium]|nr:3-methyl-2-oxobutanoate hydroxymethyltransferase [Elusimicrobiota bacterium]
MKKQGRKITMLTCYQYSFSKLLNECGVDVLLVGDSLGMVVLGHENTLPVTIEDMLHHTKAVKRGNSKSLLVSDMPYLSYEIDPSDAVRYAGKLIKEGGAEAVKLEGGLEMAPTIRKMLQANIPIMGHLGLTPQAIHRLGGYKVQGKKQEDADRILKDALALEEAGIFSLVLECVPSALAKQISQKLSIPTIGIGAGPHCDGQVLVLDDMLGLFPSPKTPKFVKQYAHLYETSRQAIEEYCQEVREEEFPSSEHEYE